MTAPACAGVRLANPRSLIRRALLAAAILLPLAAAPLVRPPVADAGTCPADAAGVLEKATYRLGERLDFYGIYTDFADPGTVTITFRRAADGATRVFTAFNSADGSWDRTVVFTSSADIGAWRVHADVAETSGTKVCDDRFTLLGANPPPVPTPPNTATTDAVPPNRNSPLPFVLVVVGLIAFLIALWGTRLRR
jgi:hypothetical protein